MNDWSKGKDPSLSNLIREKYENLGKATSVPSGESFVSFQHNLIRVEPVSRWEQICVGVIFCILVTLWVTRDLHGVMGWGTLFKAK